MSGLLDNVCPGTSARAALSLEKHDRYGKVRTTSPVFQCTADWVTQTGLFRMLRHGPRHQTVRLRRIAPRYPNRRAFEHKIDGRLVLLPEGLTLEPGNVRLPCCYISANTIYRAAFYRDCVEIIHGGNKRTLVRCENVEALDVLFQAYF